MKNLAGQTIKGYELLDRIGAGGFGAVYRAYQSTVGREVAVKIILPGYANQPDFIRRFEAEAQLVARLEHLHIVPLYDYWRSPEGAYLVMRWLRGGSVRDALEEGPFSLEAAALLLDQVASALATAHANGIVHRDLKTSNILLDEEGNAYLADFGIANDLNQLVNSSPADEQLIGSPSPEQARGEPITPQTDIYGLGITLYEILTGTQPFPGLNAIERLFKHINDPIPLIETLDPHVRDEINDVVQRATANNPKLRYADVLAMAAAFREAAKLGEVGRDVELLETLTLREQEILRLVVEGHTNRQIAQELYIELSTVKWHIRQIYSKLGVRSRKQAVVRARELKLMMEDVPAEQADEVKTGIVSVAALPPVNPYKGLRAFEPADSRDFFGREAFLKKLLDRLAPNTSRTPSQETDRNGDRFLAIVGPSGSGKSSLVNAGLIPVLREGAIEGAERWFIVEMAPGSRPLDELEVALLRVAADQAGNIRDQLERDRNGLLRAADLILPRDNSELLLVIDQFEELFTLVSDETYRTHFLNILTAAATDIRSRVRIIITLRADFYDRPLHYPEFGKLIRNHMETVLPLTAEELERAILHPANQVGVEYEPGLVATIIDDVLYQPGALPLLQYALTELFEGRAGRTLTRAAYETIGGTAGALARRAEELYHEQESEGQEAIRQLFLRLVALDDDSAASPDTRQRVLRSELTAVVQDEELMDELIDEYAAYRLLTLDHDPNSRCPMVEIAHEALLREWQRLRGWLDESRDDLRLRRQLTRAAEEWRLADQDPSFALSGTRLVQFETWSESTQLALTRGERDYLQASAALRDEREAAESARQAREAKLEQRAGRVLQALVVVFLLAALVSVGLVFIATNQRQSALASAADAQNVALVAGSQAALANHDIDTALALAWQAVALNPDSAIAQAQLSVAAYAPGTVRMLTGNKDMVTWTAISPDDKTVIAGADDGSVILWELATGQILWQHQINTQVGEPWVQNVAFSPDGQFVAATFDDRIMFWQADTGQLIRQIESIVNRQKITFNPTGDQFATIGSEEHSRLVVWDFASGEVVREFERGSNIEDIVYTADGSAILIASRSGVLTLIDAQTGEVIYEVEEDFGTSAGALRYIALSPDGTRVIGAFSDAGLLVWDFGTGELLQNFSYYGVISLAFHPQDGTVLIGDYSILRSINLQTGAILDTNTGHSRGILSIAITSDGSRAVTTGVDQTVRVWDLHSGQMVRRFADPNVTLGEVALSPDGRTVLSGSTDGSATLWDVETGEEIRRFVDDQPITAVTFSPDGSKALIGAGYLMPEKVESGHIILWDVETGGEIQRFEGQPYAVEAVGFSPDGRLAVSSGNGAIAILWEVKTGAEIRRFEDYWVDSMWPIESYLDVQFSPDGQQIFASHASGPIIGWDVDSGAEIQQLVGHSLAAEGIVFSNDGQRLVSGGSDSQIILWDMQTGNILRRFANHVGGIGQVQLSPDETLLLSGSLTGTNSLWRVETGEEIRRYGGGFVISSQFTPDGRHAVVGYQNGAVELWRIDTTLDELLTWTRNNRYIPELTCEQREFYRVEPLCELESN
jgi:WD40 repeat protein/serine/threonine protein kinase/energy-coupling factor transporter ATP-binding protein EcfA2